MVIGRALGESAGELPLHHSFPADGPPLSRQFGRGTPRRSRAGMAALKQTQRMPEPVLRAAMKVLGPPERAPRR
jgi:acyl-CoA dehydrogenase